MSVTAAQVLVASGAGASDTDLATAKLAEAVQHVTDYVTDSLIDAAVPVPEGLLDAAVLQCAVDLFARAKAPFGQQAIPDGTGSVQVVRLGADPLGGVRPILARYCFSIGFA